MCKCKQEMAQIIPLALTEPINPRFFNRVKRRLSFKGRTLVKRKSSETSLNSLHLEGLFTEQLCRKISNISRESSCPLEDEQLFRILLRSVLHTLGSPETTIGLRRVDLVEHLRQIFDVEREDHEFYVRDEILNKPTSHQLTVTVLEAQNLKPQDTTTSFDSYCLLSIVRPSQSKGSPRTSPKSSPRTSPKSSPRTSPKLKRIPKSPSIDQPDVLRTSTNQSTLSPKWNEEFQFDITDIQTDELHIYLCDQDSEKHAELSRTDSQKHSGLKSLFRQLRQYTDHGRLVLGAVGMVTIPLRDLPAIGTSSWYKLTSRSKPSSSAKEVGHLRLRMQVSMKQNSFCEVGCIMDTCYKAVEKMLKYALQLEGDKHNIELSISKQSRRILDIFAIGHQISKLSQAILELIVLLEIVPGQSPGKVSSKVLLGAIERLQAVWMSMQIEGSAESQMPLTDTEIMLYQEAAMKYIHYTCAQLEKEFLLFPPNVDAMDVIEAKLQPVIHLLDLDLWGVCVQPQKEVVDLLTNKIQRDVHVWVQENLSLIPAHDNLKDPVIPQIANLIEIVNFASSHCKVYPAVKSVYDSIGLKYYRIVSFALESKIAHRAQDLMQQLDKYQMRYQKFPENIYKSSRSSLLLYFALRKLYRLVKSNLSVRDLFRLLLSQYQEWFKESLVFWVQTFKTECMSRMEKALEIDKDVPMDSSWTSSKMGDLAHFSMLHASVNMVLVTSLVKYSNSSVDVKSFFAKITEEWREINFHDPDRLCMGVTKITDLICDNTRLYADKIGSVLERNCYYDNEQGQFDVTDRLCITLNNIEHVRLYMDELSELLEWDHVAEAVSLAHEDPQVGKQALRTWKRLIRTTHQDVLMKSQLLLQQITAKMNVDIARYMEIFTVISPEKAGSIDMITSYLSTNLRTLYDKLMGSIYPKMREQLSYSVFRCFDQQLMSGKPPEYYRQMKRHMNTLSHFFVQTGVEEDRICHNCYGKVLTEKLNLCSSPTQELILQYYNELSSIMTTPVEYYGHLAVKMAYIEETRGKVTVYVNVISATDLPGLDPTGLSDPYVVISVEPRTLFGQVQKQRTKMVEETFQTLNPVFNTTFQFPNIPKEYLSLPGAVMVLSVFDHDTIGSDDFAGEVIIGLSSIQRIDLHTTVNSLAVVMMPLKRPTYQYGPLQILRERMLWDNTARIFVKQRLRFIENQPVRTDKPQKKNSFFSFFAKLAT